MNGIIILRNDNGSQFVAHHICECLKDNNIDQKFTQVATPEENAFIEAYQSILERNVCQRYQFESIYDAGLVMNKWKNYYNDQRLHGSLGNKIPQQTWDNYLKINKVK